MSGSLILMNKKNENKLNIETRLAQDIWVKTCYITDKEGLQHEVIHYGDLKDVIREVTGWMI